MNIRNKKELQKAFQKMQKETRAGKFIVQSMQEPGFEIIAGMKRDKSFGPVIVAGLGGTFTEIFKDSAIFIPPFSTHEVRDHLQKLAIYPILKGFRGQKGYDTGEISKILTTLQDIAFQNLGISEIDINPAILYNNGKETSIVDAKIFLNISRQKNE